MDLGQFELVPGIITNVDDPEKLGRIKCSAVGLFDPSTMDDDVLPWVMPLDMNKFQMFSKPDVGRKVWILDNRDNENEFWYIMMFDYTDITERLVKEKYDNDLEVIVCRKTSSDSAQLYYDSEEGFVTKLDEWKANIKPTGDITLHGKDGDIDIRSGHVYAGNNLQNSSYEPSTKCDQLRSIFSSLADAFGALSSSASAGPNDNMNLVEPIQKIKKIFADASGTKICAKNVSVN